MNGVAQVAALVSALAYLGAAPLEMFFFNRPAARRFLHIEADNVADVRAWAFVPWAWFWLPDLYNPQLVDPGMEDGTDRGYDYDEANWRPIVAAVREAVSAAHVIPLNGVLVEEVEVRVCVALNPGETTTEAAGLDHVAGARCTPPTLTVHAGSRP